MSDAAKLTKKVVDQSEPGAARYTVWDSELKGFGLRVEPRAADGAEAATKTYVLYYRMPSAGRGGARGHLRLGRHGQITAEQAREQAKIALGQVAGGIDPALERAKARRGGHEANQVDDRRRTWEAVP